MDVKVYPLAMSSSWLSKGLIPNPTSIYAEYRERRASWFGQMTTAIVEAQTDEGNHGFGTVGRERFRLHA